MANEDGKNSPDLGAVSPASQTPGAGPTTVVNAAGDYFEETVDPEEYARLLDLYDNSFRHISEGEVVKGTVLKVTASEVVVDVGYKSEGIIAVDEFVDENGQVTVQPGDTVDVLLERTEDRDGYVVLSREKAEKMKIWDEIEKAYADRKVVIGRVIERIKGGLAVDIGVRAFLPGSQVDVRPVRNLDALRGQELRMRVIKVNKKRGNIVLSRKVLLEEENAEKKKYTLATLAEGKVLRGVVKNITDYGAFIDLGGIDGLCHITDMSWGRVSHPSEVLKINQKVRVKVLKIDPKHERISLGLKQLSESPWKNIQAKYPVGAKFAGSVVNVLSYGAFVKLEDGVEGLVHVSEMSWTKRINHPSEVVQIGDKVEVIILDVNPQKQEISLGMKQVQANPWTLVERKYPPGTIIEGKVRNLTNYGAFVEIEEGIDGLLHVTDLSWTKKILHPSEILKKGDSVRAIVLTVDQEKKRVALGVKQLEEDPWDREIPEKYRVGETVTGVVTKITNFGVFVELEDNLEGLLHISELADRKIDNPAEIVNPNQSIEVKVIKIDPEERKIGLSLRRALEE
jgi:small subunit ribosomal protein S1